MAKINNTSAYAISSPVTADDIVIGSVGGNGGDTKNFTVGDIRDFIFSATANFLSDVGIAGSLTVTGPSPSLRVANTSQFDGDVQLNSKVFISAPVPSSSGDAGVAGQIAVDSSYIYVYTGTVWGRVAIDTTPF